MRIHYLLIFLTSTFFIVAQTKPPGYRQYFEEGSYLLLENNFDRAQDNFETAYQLDSSSANINYMLGICYLQSALKKSKAEAYLERAIKNISKTYKTDLYSEKAAPPLAHFYYGKALHINYKFDEAMTQYNEFKKYVDPKDAEWQKMVDKEKTASVIAKKMVAEPINIQITNLGDSINSQYPEYSPVLSADERMLIYTTRRPDGTGGQKTPEGYYFEDIVVSYKNDEGLWSKPVSLSYNVNSFGHEACINLSPDGQTLIIFKDNNGNGDIYYSTFDGKDWSTLKEFGSNVNTEFWESHACLSADGNLLFFASDRPGGYGGKDIYRCVKLPNGNWSKALNMGPIINSEYDEDGAFIHPDGQTFFFSSNGEKTMGGYDVMFATLNDEGKFTDVTNIGYPINTTDDDIFYVTSPDGKRGYLSSAKEGGYGEKDIYRITMAGGKDNFLALFKGQIIPAEGELLPPNIFIVVADKQTNEIIGTYRPKLSNGTFATILSPGKEYNFSYQTEEGEEFYNEDVFVPNSSAYQEIERAVNLEPVKLAGKVKVRQKNIILNTLVLDSRKSKKAIAGAKIIIEEALTGQQNYDANGDGKYDGLVLVPEKTYKLFAEANGKKSAVAEISTVGSKSAKVINQVLYLEGKLDKFSSKEMILTVQVKNSKTKKVLPNVNVTLTDQDGEKIETMSDSRGRINPIELFPESSYTLMAYKDASVSEIETFTTGVLADAKNIAITLNLSYDENVIVTKSGKTYDVDDCGKIGTYTRYFTYNQRDIEIDEACWNRFIDYVAERASKRKSPLTITIQGSASRVPLRAKGGNKALAAKRASNIETKIKSALTVKGIKTNKVRIIKSSAVNGPRYKGDWNLGRKKYEKYQFTKARIK